MSAVSSPLFSAATWPPRNSFIVGKPRISNLSCSRRCAVASTVASRPGLPDHVASTTHARLLGTVHGRKLRLGIITELLRCRAELWLCVLAVATPGIIEHDYIDLWSAEHSRIAVRTISRMNCHGEEQYRGPFQQFEYKLSLISENNSSCCGSLWSLDSCSCIWNEDDRLLQQPSGLLAGRH